MPTLPINILSSFGFSLVLARRSCFALLIPREISTKYSPWINQWYLLCLTWSREMYIYNWTTEVRHQSTAILESEIDKCQPTLTEPNRRFCSATKWTFLSSSIISSSFSSSFSDRSIVVSVHTTLFFHLPRAETIDQWSCFYITVILLLALTSPLILRMEHIVQTLSDNLFRA